MVLLLSCLLFAALIERESSSESRRRRHVDRERSPVRTQCSFGFATNFYSVRPSKLAGKSSHIANLRHFPRIFATEFQDFSKAMKETLTGVELVGS